MALTETRTQDNRGYRGAPRLVVEINGDGARLAKPPTISGWACRFVAVYGVRRKVWTYRQVAS